MGKSVATIAGLASVACLTGCFGTKLQSPFDEMSESQVTVYRLQNFEPPQAQAGAAAPAGGITLPPQIQQWITQGAAMLPPGLLPPGLVPGAAAATPAPDTSTPRFENVRVIAWQQVTDPKVRDEIVKIFGESKSFETSNESCLYPEFGFAMSRSGGPPVDILVSLSCHQVRGANFQWPHANTGITAATNERIVNVVKSAFGQR
ncbi:MAG: hypothetical protein U0169_12760 [Polyangiaceae bacterium]